MINRRLNRLVKFSVLAPLVAVGVATTHVSAQEAQAWVFPVIKEYGKVYSYPNAAAQPEWVNADVTLALAALTVLPVYES